MRKLILTVLLLVTANFLLAESKSAAEQYFEQYRDSGTLITSEEAKEIARQKKIAETKRLAEEEKAAAEAQRIEEEKFTLPSLNDVKLDTLIDSIASDSEADTSRSEIQLQAEQLGNDLLEKLKKKPLIPYSIIFFCIALLLGVISHIILLVKGFEQSLGWGFAILFLPFAALIFCFVKFQQAKVGFFLWLASVLCLITSIILLSLSVDSEMQKELQDFQKHQKSISGSN